MIEAVLGSDIPDGWTRDISATHHVPVRILDCIPLGDKGARSFMDLERNDPEMQKMVSRALGKHPEVCKWEPAITDGRMRGMAPLTMCRACKVIMRSDCHHRSAKNVGNGKVEGQAIASREGALGGIIDGPRRAGAGPTCAPGGRWTTPAS